MYNPTQVTAERLLDLTQAQLHTLARRNGFDPKAFPGKYGATDLAVALAAELLRCPNEHLEQCGKCIC